MLGTLISSGNYRAVVKDRRKMIYAKFLFLRLAHAPLTRVRRAGGAISADVARDAPTDLKV